MPFEPHVPLISNNIAFVGEAPGEQEALVGKPFMGASGQELTRMMRDAGLVRSSSYLTNVFFTRPEDNDIRKLCHKSKKEAPKGYPYPAIQAGHYLKEEYFGELLRLKQELMDFKPNVVVALGNTALWALTMQTKIKKLRGTIMESSLVPGLKILPTYHPAYVLRDYSARVVTIADLIKAGIEAEYPEIRRPKRSIFIVETIEDIHYGITKVLPEIYLGEPWDENSLPCAFDIETSHGTITSISFSIHPDRSLVIPFHDRLRLGYSFWRTDAEEREAWNWVRFILGSPWPKLAQNGMYDVQYLRTHGVSVVNFTHDTMLCHHSLFPEMPKGLDFLGSLYTNEPAWKLMRERGTEQLKRDE